MNTYNRVKSTLTGSKEKGISIGNGGHTNEVAQSSRGKRSPETSEAELSQVAS